MTCCAHFGVESTAIVGRDKLMGGGYLTPEPVGNEPRLQKLDDGYAVLGCCGACYVLSQIKFCPWCGAAL